MDVRTVYVPRRRRRRTTWLAVAVAVACAIPAVAMAISNPPQPPVITVYVGVAGGTSSGYRATHVGAAWTRTTSVDVPDVGGSAFPTLADLDGNGTRDMLVGNSDGHVLAFRNAGTDADPVWQRKPTWDPSIDVGSLAAPAVADLDGDGVRDLVIGNSGGDVIAMKNTGTKHGPVWTRDNAWDLGHLGAAARPATADFNHDGHTDVIVGLSNGKLMMFTGTGDGTAPLARAASWDVSGAGTNPAPAAADLDGDGRPDLLVVDSGAHLTAAFKNTGSALSSQPGWVGSLDAGSGPGGLAVIATPAGTPTSSTTIGSTTVSSTTASTVPGGPVAHVSATPANGKAPLPVSFDASGSTDPSGRTLHYSWDFGDGTTSTNGSARAVADTADDGALLTLARNAFNTADAQREHGDKVGSIAGYLQAGNTFASLTGDPGAAPFVAHGFHTINKIAYFYLTKLGHDLGDVYTFNDIPGFATECDRLQLGYLYFKDQFTEATAGGFPGLPSDPTFGGAVKLQISLQKLHDNKCTVPDTRPMWDTSSTPPPPPPSSDATQDHTYTRSGRYSARVTVDDGVSTATATVTIVVGDTPPPPPPPPPPSGGNVSQPLEGFGAQTRGGAGGTVVHVSEATDDAVRHAFSTANHAAGPTIITFDTTGPITIDSSILVTANNLTVEGNGATLVASPALGETVGATLQFAGHDVIVRNIRLRNGGDNLRAQPTKDNPDGTYNIVFDHISSTGANDDGISIGYGSHDVTVQYSFLAGNDRSIFIKYGDTTRISLHHNWIMKQWIRGPMASSSAFVDVRNDINQDWQLWGMRYEQHASGNVINTLYDESAYAQQHFGNAQDGMINISDQPVYTSGLVFVGAAHASYDASSDTELPAAPVTTQSVADMVPNVKANAGAMPRDSIDEQYIDYSGSWSLGDRNPLRLG